VSRRYERTEVCTIGSRPSLEKSERRRSYHGDIDQLTRVPTHQEEITVGARAIGALDVLASDRIDGELEDRWECGFDLDVIPAGARQFG